MTGRLKDCPCHQGVKAAQAGNRVTAMACAAPTQNSTICTGTSRAGVRGDAGSRPLHGYQHLQSLERLLSICQQHMKRRQICWHSEALARQFQAGSDAASANSHPLLQTQSARLGKLGKEWIEGPTATGMLTSKVKKTRLRKKKQTINISEARTTNATAPCPVISSTSSRPGFSVGAWACTKGQHCCHLSRPVVTG